MFPLVGWTRAVMFETRCSPLSYQPIPYVTRTVIDDEGTLGPPVVRMMRKERFLWALRHPCWWFVSVYRAFRWSRARKNATELEIPL